jgi:alcohol oxidase
MPMEPGKAPKPSWLNSNAQHVLEDLQYTKEDIKHVEDWVKRTSPPFQTHRTDN